MRCDFTGEAQLNRPTSAAPTRKFIRKLLSDDALLPEL